METKARHLAVGLFVLVLLAGLAGFTIWIAKFSGQVTYVTYYARFADSVAQLRIDSTVLFGGIPVGRVTDVRIDMENTELARVDFQVRAGTPLRVDSEATIEIQSLAGGVVLQLSRGSATGDLLTPGTEIRAGASAMQKIATQAPDLLNKLNDIAGNINAMLTAENRQALTDTLSNLRDLSAELKGHAPEIENMLTQGSAAMEKFASAGDTLDQLAKQLQGNAGTLTDDAHASLTQVSKLAKTLNGTVATLDAVIGENRGAIRQFTGGTLYEATDLIAELRELAASMARISEEIERDPARFFLSDRSKGYKPK